MGPPVLQDQVLPLLEEGWGGAPVEGELEEDHVVLLRESLLPGHLHAHARTTPERIGLIEVVGRHLAAVGQMRPELPMHSDFSRAGRRRG